jgi:hypothetical protein
VPATVSDDPLAVHCVFPNGTAWTAALSGLPNPALAADLARGLALHIHPHGPVASKNVAQQYAVSLRIMVRSVSALGFVGSASELTPSVLLRFWLNTSHSHERKTRTLLQNFDEATGALRPEVRNHLAGRAMRPKTKAEGYQPYTETEWQRLTDCCQQDIDTSETAHRAMLREAESGIDPRDGGISRANLAWLMLQHGPLSVGEILTYHRGHRRVTKHTLDGEAIREVREALFPTLQTQVAYRLLLGCYTGVVPDGIDDLGVSDIDWAGDATVLLRYLKGRSGPEGITLSPRAVRILQRWLDHSAVLRRFAPTAKQNSLWLACPLPSVWTHRGGRIVTSPQKSWWVVGGWVQRHGLTGDDGQLLAMHRGRIRTTYENLLAGEAGVGAPRSTPTTPRAPRPTTTWPPPHQHSVMRWRRLSRKGRPTCCAKRGQRWCSPRSRPRNSSNGFRTQWAVSAWMMPRWPNSWVATAMSSPPPVSINSPGCTGRLANPAPRGHGCVCCARWRSSCPDTFPTCCG